MVKRLYESLGWRSNEARKVLDEWQSSIGGSGTTNKKVLDEWQSSIVGSGTTNKFPLSEIDEGGKTTMLGQ